MNIRAPRDEDAEALFEIARASDLALLDETDWTEGEMRELLAEADLERDAWVVESDGRPVAFATVEVRHGGRVVSDGYVHPDLRGRGIGSELLRLIEARARQEPDERLRLVNATLAGDPCKPNLYAANGFTPSGHVWFMSRELVGSEEAPGAGLRTYEHPADATAVHAVEQEAFTGHPRGYEPYDRWAAKHFDRDGFDPGLWFVAPREDGLAGCITARRDADGGYVEMVGVRPPSRGQGLGEALLRRAVAEFARRGERRVSLTVDSIDPTGATRLYERVGFAVRSQTDLYEKVLRG
jgi:mycothiol synthase